MKMRLQELIRSLDCEVTGPADARVTEIICDSRKVTAPGKDGGVMFAAMPGEHVDGSVFIKNAVESGATCVLTEKKADNIRVPQVLVRDVREALAEISAALYGAPAQALKMVGVTGTNGKTTTTYLLESIFNAAGLRCGVIGTVNYRYGGKTFDAPHTTPQAPELQKLLKEMRDGGVTHCVMEVSSHALAQKRVAGCRFDAGVFTNLTHEHLDYHRTMDEYFSAKSILFERLLKKDGARAVLNIDDPWGKRLSQSLGGALSFSLSPGADIYPKSSTLTESGIEARINTPGPEISVSSRLVGEYNLQNIMGAVGAAYALGIDKGAVERGVNALKRVPGRLEKITSAGRKKITAYVDYAHTGDALERALTALRKVAGGRIITVFGCGGNRDRLKRPQMGEISARLSDFTVVTSDNPRDEDPVDIIKEIEAGLAGVKKLTKADSAVLKGYITVPERREAIRKAVGIAQSGDTVLVAGKGHEDYQIVKGVKHHFDDIEVLKEAMDELCV